MAVMCLTKHANILTFFILYLLSLYIIPVKEKKTPHTLFNTVSTFVCFQLDIVNNCTKESQT